MSFLRLSRGHVIAALAALALLLVMTMDWYTTSAGESFRRDEMLSQPDSDLGVEASDQLRERQEDADIQAQQEERIAWQPAGAIDWLVLIALIATVVAALAAAVLRASSRRYAPPLTPAVLAASLAMVAAALTVFRVIERSLTEPGAQIEAGVPLGLVCLGLIALGSARAARSEDRAEPAEPAGAAS